MEQKNDLDKLLVSYLLKELTAEEEARIINSINSDPALFRHFEELKNVLMLVSINQNIDGINLEEERKHFDEIYRLKQTQPKISPSLYDITGVEQPTGFKTYKFLRVVAVAASVALILGLGWRMFHYNEVNDPAVAHKNRTIKSTQKLFTKNELNVSGVTRNFLLKDGPQITLWDQSMITFEDPFSANRRDITLSGKAGFKVAKDKTKPFTVFSGDITTTALGTEFIVSNFINDQNIIVHLLEGKVVIKSAEKAKIKLKKPVYLLAGQELSYNKQTATVMIRNIGKNSSKRELAKENVVSDNPSVPKNNKGSWYMFNNQSLPQIFDQLEEMFGVEIIYNRKDVEKLYFIGKFDKTDSLEYILKNITSINHLNLLKQNNKFFISK